ncbi:MAG: CopG family ribbon-helix-helix protein [Candidatus Bathyarchaeota archaeon]|nr:CopG family ribbon-helix-helix protein [Candidatus Bathyarchaeota archaeon]
MTVISVSVPENLLQRVENSMREQGFANRSEIVRQALRHLIAEGRELTRLTGEVVATVTIIFERKAKRKQISDVQHSYGDAISTFLHVHIDDDYCLEVIVVKGEADVLRRLVDALRTNEQIIQIKVAVLRETRR